MQYGIKRVSRVKVDQSTFGITLELVEWVLVRSAGGGRGARLASVERQAEHVLQQRGAARRRLRAHRVVVRRRRLRAVPVARPGLVVRVQQAGVLSHAVLQGHQQRVHVLEPFELRLVDVGDHALVIGREMHGLVSELRREVGEVPFAFQTGLERRHHLFLLQHLPLDALEEGMVDDVEEAVLAAAEPLHRVLVEEALQHRGRLHGQRARDTDRLLQYHLEEIVFCILVGVVSSLGDVEGRSASQHLVREDPERPPVHGEAVLLAAEDLRRDVVGSAAERRGRVARTHSLLAHSVIGELDVSLVVEQHVVQLEVAVDDAALVQEVQRQRDLGRVEPRVLLRQPPLTLHVEHQIPSPDELDHEEQSARCLEAGVQADQEWVVRGGLEHVFLSLNPVDVLVVGDERLLYHLHSVYALRAF